MNRFNRVLAGTLLLPMLFGALVLWSMSDRYERADRVPAAVVNLDKPVTMGKGKDAQVIAAGRLLAAGLTSPDDAQDSSLGWELTEASKASTGLRDGDYYAVVTIPRGFSRTLSKITGDSPTRAGITLQTNDASSAVIGEASKQVAEVAAARLGRQVTSTYLQGLNEQTGKLKDQLTGAANGAGRLAEGTTKLDDGARQLGGGASSLADGLEELSSGAEQLADGSEELAGGASRLHQGAGRLADGLGALSRRTDDLPDQTRQLADGAGQVSKGVGPYTEIVKAWATACTTNPAVAATNARLCAGTIEAAGVAGRNADQLAAGARQVATGSDRLADATPQLANAIDQAAGGARKLDAGSGELADGAARLSDGAAKLATGAGQASTGAARLASGSQELADGTGRLDSGSTRLADGLREGAEKIPDAAQGKPEVIADPVRTTAKSLNPVRDGTTLLLPAVLAFALWLGAFVTYLVRQALPLRWLRRSASGRRIALAGWLPAVAIGVAQSALLLTSALLLGAELESPLGVAALMVLAAAVFAALNQAFVAVSGQRRGWIASIAFAAVQLVSLGGLVPIDTAPGPFRVLNAVLPVSRAADGFARLTLGGEVGSLVGDVVLLLLWGLGALAVTAFAARRAQKLDLTEVRALSDDAVVAGAR